MIDEKQDIIGVVGTGTIGIQIAFELIRHGYPVILKTRREDSRIVAKDKINRLVERYLNGENHPTLALTITTEYSDLYSCSMVIEAVLESLEVKCETFARIAESVKDETILATNTSSLSIDRLAANCPNPKRFVGVHFFNPVHKMRLVEIVRGGSTSQETIDWAIHFSESLNKIPVTVKNSPGFVVNRLLIPQINDAIRVWEQGVASKADIDAAVKLGLNHPMGPFELADLIGLDVCLSILNTLKANENNDRFEPADSLLKLVRIGKLGKKTGEGFYNYRR